MINLYRRHQCWIFQVSGAAGFLLAASLELPPWGIVLIGAAFAVPAAVQDRRNRRRLQIRRIIERCRACNSVTAYPREPVAPATPRPVELTPFAQQAHGHPGRPFLADCRHCQALADLTL